MYNDGSDQEIVLVLEPVPELPEDTEPPINQLSNEYSLAENIIQNQVQRAWLPNENGHQSPMHNNNNNTEIVPVYRQEEPEDDRIADPDCALVFANEEKSSEVTALAINNNKTRKTPPIR